MGSKFNFLKVCWDCFKSNDEGIYIEDVTGAGGVTCEWPGGGRKFKPARVRALWRILAKPYPKWRRFGQGDGQPIVATRRALSCPLIGFLKPNFNEFRAEKVVQQKKKNWRGRSNAQRWRKWKNLGEIHN